MRHKLAVMSGKSLVAWAVMLVIGLGAAAPSASAARAPASAVPFGFVGMDVDQPVWPNPGIDFSQQLDVMVASGVDSLRAVIDWSNAQPYATWSQVPADEQSSGQFVDVDGIPTDFTEIDALVAEVAEHGMTLLPVIINAPPWDAQNYNGQVSVPRTPGPYAAFVKALVLRYGPNGSFWRENPQIPKLPVEAWQVWNEPNVWAFWPQGPQPFYRGYVPLLRATYVAIKQADPRAKVVLAGMPNWSWISIRQVIQHGGRNLFDVVDVHPYTRTPQGVIRILGYVRRVLNRYGHSQTPIIAGEISWPSSEGKGATPVGFDISTTEAGQAKRIGTLMRLLARYRRPLELSGFDYYDWAGLDQPGAELFSFSGLFHLNPSTYQFTAKPAYYVFRNEALALEGCRGKGVLATECLR